jgi:hypothetical protein
VPDPSANPASHTDPGAICRTVQAAAATRANAVLEPVNLTQLVAVDITQPGNTRRLLTEARGLGWAL